MSKGKLIFIALLITFVLVFIFVLTSFIPFRILISCSAQKQLEATIVNIYNQNSRGIVNGTLTIKDLANMHSDTQIFLDRDRIYAFYQGNEHDRLATYDYEGTQLNVCDASYSVLDSTDMNKCIPPFGSRTLLDYYNLSAKICK